MLTTKKGDGGYTRLADGTSVTKTTPQCAACGELDEFNSVLGLARVMVDRYINLRQELEYIQSTLPAIMTEVSCFDSSKLTMTLTINDVQVLDKKRDALEKRVVLPKGFIMPGDTEISARLHHARAVCRRCERAIVGLYNGGLLQNSNILMFMNRLSDYLYLLAISAGGLK